MKNETEINFVDYFVIFIKNRNFFIGYTFLFMVIFYLLIFFFVEEQYDSSALIVPSQDNAISGIAGMLGDLGGLPFGLGGASNPEIGLYNTILTSRTVAEEIIEKFNLWEFYKLDPNKRREVKKARERFQESIGAEETDDGAYIISVRSPDSVLSANIANYMLEYLNKKIIELKIDKSRKNRIFLEKRLTDVRTRLTNSENNLKEFQSETGMLIPEEQIKNLLSAYAVLEKDLMTKQLQKEVLEKIYDDKSPKLEAIRIEVELFQEKLSNIKEYGKENSIFTPYSSIPEDAVEYYRLYREIEINNAILQFVLPLYEQAKIEEQKDIPVLQVIDYAKPAEEKSFPRRSIFTLVFGFGVFIFLFSYKVLKENVNVINSEKYQYVFSNMFKLKTKSDTIK